MAPYRVDDGRVSGIPRAPGAFPVALRLQTSATGSTTPDLTRVHGAAVAHDRHHSLLCEAPPSSLPSRRDPVLNCGFFRRSVVVAKPVTQVRPTLRYVCADDHRGLRGASRSRLVERAIGGTPRLQTHAHRDGASAGASAVLRGANLHGANWNCGHRHRAAIEVMNRCPSNR